MSKEKISIKNDDADANKFVRKSYDGLLQRRRSSSFKRKQSVIMIEKVNFVLDLNFFYLSTSQGCV